jgi:hypothetical protein
MMKTLSKATALPPLKCAKYLAHGRAIIEVLDYVAAHMRLLDVTMGDTADDSENHGGQIEMMAEKFGVYLSRLITFDNVDDVKYTKFITLLHTAVPSTAALAEILAIVHSENNRKPSTGWNLPI